MDKKTTLIISIIIGISIVLFGFLNYRAKTKALEYKEKSQKEKLLNFTICNRLVEKDYHNYWNSQCQIQGTDKKTSGCALSGFTAGVIEKRREKALENCIKLYSVN